MPPRKTTAATDQAGWTPPAGAQQIELSEFFSFGKIGETVIGRIQRVTERPDPLNAEKIMRAVVLSPAVVHAPGGKSEAYRSLAVGLSAHLGLLLGDPSKEVGSAYAFVYQGTRPAQEKGKQASKQFDVYKLSENQFAAEVKNVAGKGADLLLAGGSDDEAPF